MSFLTHGRHARSPTNQGVPSSSLTIPGDLTLVNIESLLKLKPQVVFVANYTPPEMVTQIEQAAIPVVIIALRQDQAGDKPDNDR